MPGDDLPMPIKIWPNDFERKEHIYAEERFLLRNALKNFKEGCFVTGIDPLGFCTEQVHMGMYISPEQGLITFSIVQNKIDATQVPMLQMAAENIEQSIYERLVNSKLLIVRHNEKKLLKFPYKHIYLFVNEDVPVNSVDADALTSFAPYSAIRFFIPTTAKNRPKFVKDLHIFENIRMPYDSNFKRITEAESLAIFERLAPEYTVVMKEREEVYVPEIEDELPAESEEITGDEVEYRTFYLDDYQVGQINDMGRGHRVILANAGAGKSVLLLSKAFKYTGMYKGSNVLLTCFNNNLADSYRFKKSCAAMTGHDRKLYILTLHRLVAKLFKECLGKTIDEYATDEEIEECIAAIKDGRIKIRFKAIFIDEVQIFTPLWLELCYSLLESSQESLFLMAGDLNQTVRSQSRRGDAPWKKIADGKLDFTGRVKYIEKNYRNSPEISGFLNRMLTYMNSKLSELDMINLDEFEYDTFENGDSKNVALKITTEINRGQIKDVVIGAIHEIADKYHIGYSEIAVLYPQKGNRLFKYNFLYWVTEGLKQDQIQFSIISTPEDGQKVKYSDTRGVVLSSIDSSLGLDFRAVIIAGLYPFNYVFDSNSNAKKLSSWETVGKLEPDVKENVQVEMRKLYTACSRAREVLYVLSDLTPGTIMDDIIKNGEK
ncbi:MAG: hypothetical protein EGS40_06555 [Agathobacter sp.]|jgi:hypothetical protein|nr:hypothetical protein [Agathobacter sp.]MBD9286888.1 hypothetical protein [Agathobacter sp.]